MLGHHRITSETPFKWRFAGGPMMVRFLWYLDPLINLKKVGPPLKNFLDPRMQTTDYATLFSVSCV